MQAEWNGKTIASSNETIVVEGNHYFPPSSVDEACLSPSKKATVCPWKGTAFYFDVVVDGRINEAAAWYYPEPSERAMQIKNYVAFWRGVEVSDR
jgi:uncharacterized protein (DUF427 family)